MATKKAPTKEQILEALRKNGIKNLEELIEALLPNETGGYALDMWMSEENEFTKKWLENNFMGRDYGSMAEEGIR